MVYVKFPVCVTFHVTDALDHFIDFRLMTNEEKRISDREAAIETKDSRTTALIKEKEEKIIRVK